jgi:TetR/AcrR family transcriptional repressor of nem operon
VAIKRCFLPRPRSFEEEAALEAAINCFWRQGQEGASVRDLAAEMGINGPSLYNAFGDKQALFARSLDRYVATNVRERITRLEQNFGPRIAITSFFEELLARSIADPEQRGCLLINAAIETPKKDTALTAALHGYVEEIRCFFKRCLERALIAREIPETIHPDDMSRLLMAVVIGLRVTAKRDASAATLTGIVRPILTLLDPSPPSKGVP